MNRIDRTIVSEFFDDKQTSQLKRDLTQTVKIQNNFFFFVGMPSAFSNEAIDV